jgi:integrase
MTQRALTSAHLAPGVAALAMIDRADHLADSTKAQYRKALRNYLDAGHSLTDPEALANYALALPRSSRAFLKAAVKMWSEALATEVKGQATPENVDAVQAAVYRLEALQEAITTKKEVGQKTHTWLSKAEVKRLLDTCEADVVGQRDRLLLGLLVAAGLRRKEAANLRFEDVKLVPRGDRFRTVLAIEGKGAKDRTVPISDALANAIDKWAGVVGGQGYILRSLGMNREPGESMTPVAIFNTVHKRGAMIGKSDLAPHDLRRTYAQIGFEEGIPITQLATLLGHASVETTQRYLNLELDLEVTASDFVPF